jgi:hypothetical protein
VEARHALFLVTILADAATLSTTSVIIGMDFLSNIYHGLKIIYFIKKKKASPSDENSKFKITYLVLIKYHLTFLGFLTPSLPCHVQKVFYLCSKIGQIDFFLLFFSA